MASVSHTKPVSSIAVAFAIQSASSNIPIPQDGGLVAAGGAHSGALPTPPNSISPTLPATKRRPGLPMTGRVHTPEQGDMDIDLQDAVEHAAAQDQPASALSKEALAGLDATRQITALMLAKHHLPGIILGHGAMPIREMMAHLTHSVPGFSRLPPAKARRLVVAALEHRAGGGLHGEVKFEKVGWGRWSVAGQSSQTKGVPIGGHVASSRNGPTPPASVDSAGGLQIPKAMRNQRDMYSGSWAAGSPDSRDEEMADQMSLDGSDDSETDSDASDMDLEEDLNDDTDQEDWSNMGPDQLREQRRGPRREVRDYNYLSARCRSASAQAQSMPFSRDGRAFSPKFNTSISYSASRGNPTGLFNNTTSSSGVTTGTGANMGGQNAERDAIEALVAMGCSM